MRSDLGCEHVNIQLGRVVTTIACHARLDGSCVMLYMTLNGNSQHPVQGIVAVTSRRASEGLIEPQRLLDMATFIAVTADFEGLAVPPNYGFHALTGNRKGTYAMMVTRNWRLIFVKQDSRTLAELDLEDYH